MRFIKLFVIFVVMFFCGLHINAQINLGDKLIAHYQFNGNSQDESGNGYHASVFGAYLVEDRFGNCEYAYAFSKSPDLVALPGKIMNGLESFSVSLWVKTSESGVLITAANTLRHNEFFIQVLPQGNLGTTVRANPRMKGQRVDGNKVITDGDWHHIVVTRNAFTGVMELYVDSQLDIRTNRVFAGNSLPKEALVVPSNGLYLGADQDCVGGCWDPNQQFKGVMDDVRIFERVINDGEVRALFEGVEPNPTPKLNIESTISVCADSYELDAGEGFQSYSWSTGATGQKITVTESGVYHVRVKYLSCEYTTSLSVELKNTSLVGVSADKRKLLCEGDIITLTATSGFDSYEWSDGQRGQQVTVNSPGRYYVIATNECGEVKSEELIIEEESPLNLSIEGSSQEISCFDPPIMLKASEGFVTYEWSHGASGRYVEVSYPGVYFLRASDECGNEYTAEITITEKESTVFIPNTITPNGDGKNDTFEVDSVLNNPELIIFNRWGKEIYVSKSYKNDWGGEGVREGVFYYSLSHPCLSEPIKGWIRVIK